MRGSMKKKSDKRVQIEINNQHMRSKLKKHSVKLLKELQQIGEVDNSNDYCIKALCKEPHEREGVDLAYIKTFLEYSDLARKFKSDNIPEESLQQLLVMCGTAMQYLHVAPKQILFRIGDEATYFYIIVSGIIEILKPKLINMTISGYEYFEEILKLYESDEIHLLKLTIEANQSIYPIEYDKIPMLKKLLFTLFFDDYYLEPKRHREELLQIMNDSHMTFDNETITIDKEQIKNDELYYFEIEKTINNYLNDIPNNLKRKYSHFKYKNLKNKVGIFEYQSFLQLGNGAFFGDSAIDKKTTRNATIKTVTETHFCYLDIKSYRNYLLAEKQRVTTNEVNFLVNNFFLKTIPHNIFEKKYLTCFIDQEFSKGDILCIDNTKVDFIYFIKEGQVELSTKKSIYELHNMVNYLNQLSSKSKKDDNPIPSCKTDFTNIKDHLNKKLSNNLYITNGKEFLGGESLYYGLNYLYTATVVTEKVKLYKIDVSGLLKIFQSESMSYDWFAFSCKNKINVLLMRIDQIKQSQIGLIDYSIQVSQKMNHVEDMVKTINKTTKTNNKHKRLLKCEIKQVATLPRISQTPLRMTMDTFKRFETIPNGEISEPSQRKTIQNSQTIPTSTRRTKEDVSKITFNEIHVPPIVNIKKKSKGNIGERCSLILENRLLSLVTKRMQNDPLVSNNTFITVMNQKREKMRKSKTNEIDYDSSNSNCFTERIPNPKIQRRVTHIIQSRNIPLVEKMIDQGNSTVNLDYPIPMVSPKKKHSTILAHRSKNNNNLTSLDTATCLASECNTDRLNSDHNYAKMYSGKYFDEKKKQYSEYKRRYTKTIVTEFE